MVSPWSKHGPTVHRGTLLRLRILQKSSARIADDGLHTFLATRMWVAQPVGCWAKTIWVITIFNG